MNFAVCLPRLATRSLVVAMHTVLAGCAGLSGLDGASNFKCAAPAGIPCQSVTGVHLNERSGNLPSQRPVRALHGEGEAIATEFQGPGGDAVADAAGRAAVAAPRAWHQVPSSQPALGAIRSDPKVIRIWVAPWEDADGDLHDQSYVYLQIDAGRWLLEHNRERIRREFTPVRAAVAAKGPAAVANVTPQAEVGGGQAGDAQAAAIAEGRRRAMQMAGPSSTAADARTGVRP